MFSASTCTTALSIAADDAAVATAAIIDDDYGSVIICQLSLPA